MCRQILEFITPVYLVYHYEKTRLDSDVELTKLLLNASVILNATSEMAEYFVSIPQLCFLILIHYDFRWERQLSFWTIFSNLIIWSPVFPYWKVTEAKDISDFWFLL